MQNALKLTNPNNGIARLVIDLPGEKVNKLASSLMRELDQTLKAVAGDAKIERLIVQSGKENTFIAGADIHEISTIKDPDDAFKKSRMGQRIFGQLADLPCQTIAFIDGACVGGGLELALACDFRVLTDSPSTKVGLPEVKLGIIPGWGGTQRLPRLIGLPSAIELILSGKIIDGRKARRLGIADAIVSNAFREEGLNTFIQALEDRKTITAVHKRRKPSFPLALLSNNPVGRSFVFRKSLKTLDDRGMQNYPAPYAALKVIKETAALSINVGLEREAQTFSSLCCEETCRNLVHIFFANEDLKKDAKAVTHEETPPVQRAAVLGAGIMGGGIAWLLSCQGIPVRMKDIGWQAILAGLSEARNYYNQMVKRRKLKPQTVSVQMHKISGSTSYDGIHNVDIAIEAVVEDLNVKQTVLSELEKRISPNAVIASNTSSLTIQDIGKKLNSPERMVGMHFFNPVNRMPLVEVVTTPHTSPEAIARVVKLSKRLKKTPVIVKDCPGFLVNRILLPYLNEAAYMLQEGASLKTVDRVMKAFGMPMGPFLLTDEVGIDVGYKVAKNLEAAYGERMRVSSVLEAIHQDDTLLGKKSGEGFYRHDHDRPIPNTATIAKLVSEIRSQLDSDSYQIPERQILNRCVLTMVNEAAKCLEEGIVEKPEYLDMAMILGTGFPAFRGGLLRYADSRGVGDIVDQLEKMRIAYGPRFDVAPSLIEMKTNGKRFYEKRGIGKKSTLAQ